MSDERISKLARELGEEGEDLIAATLFFVSSLRHRNDKAGLAILACFAEKVAGGRLKQEERTVEEHEALAQMVREL